MELTTAFASTLPMRPPRLQHSFLSEQSVVGGTRLQYKYGEFDSCAGSAVDVTQPGLTVSQELEM